MKRKGVKTRDVLKRSSLGFLFKIWKARIIYILPPLKLTDIAHEHHHRKSWQIPSKMLDFPWQFVSLQECFFALDVACQLETVKHGETQRPPECGSPHSWVNWGNGWCNDACGMTSYHSWKKSGAKPLLGAWDPWYKISFWYQLQQDWYQEYNLFKWIDFPLNLYRFIICLRTYRHSDQLAYLVGGFNPIEKY